MADSHIGTFTVKGSAIVGFDTLTTVQKTLRKPEEQLKEFKTAGKVVLRKFLDDIKAVDIKLNGRINEDTILLKVQ
jgi:predicted transcriptional regulator